MNLTNQELKATLNNLERLQNFKRPLTEFFNKIVYYEPFDTDESNCEFYLLQDSKEEFEFIDLEIETAALKLARLLELKEKQLKNSLL